MGRRQQHVYRLEPPQFPADFPERLDEFRRAAGLSWRELARLLQVNVRSVHRWRNGARPDAGRLYSLFELAEERGRLCILLPGAAPPGESSTPLDPHDATGRITRGPRPASGPGERP